MTQRGRACNPNQQDPVRKLFGTLPERLSGRHSAGGSCQSQKRHPPLSDLSASLFQTQQALPPAFPVVLQSRPRRIENPAGTAGLRAPAELLRAPHRACAWKSKFSPFANTQNRFLGFSPAPAEPVPAHPQACSDARVHSPVQPGVSIAFQLPRASGRLRKPRQILLALLPQARSAPRIHKRSRAERATAYRARADSRQAAEVPRPARIASAAPGFSPAATSPAGSPDSPPPLVPHPPA